MSITNPFGGEVSLYPGHKAQDGDDQAFEIKYYPRNNKETHIELLPQDWSKAQVLAN